ncbi:MAG: response regulator [Gammaproteobacteria bacterium]|nr:MAG: response regulator [Gammaproteobacteria bacterium]
MLQSVAMSFKRALVVDDSKSARLALKVLLERYELIVDFAETGEEAIDFLKSQTVDVIFMDHSMPGMTGLEAVSAIKSNPRTAMIPVMMYTAKEGEVYVGQARALGAVGVLPKQVHPGALFDMLLTLGLVRDRRAQPRAEGEEFAEPTAAGENDEIEREYEQQALGISVQALVTRILQDQHVELRADILSSHRNFAKHVAEEILEKRKAEEELARLAPAPARSYGPGAMLGLAVALLIPLIAMIVLFWQVKGERDLALTENSRLAMSSEAQIVAAQAENTDLISGIESERRASQSRYLTALGALQWAVNENSQYPYEELAFSDARLETLQELLVHLSALGFQGEVRLDAYLGEFCLVADDSGTYQIADPGMLVEFCSLIGHPLDASDSVIDRQAVGFANFLATSPLVNGSGIDVQVVAHSRIDSPRRLEFPANLQTAGEWNQIAEMNNRVEYSLIPSNR